MKKLSGYFIQGLLFLIPIVVTIYLFYLGFSKVDQIFRFELPGLGFLLTLTLVTVTGFLVSTFLARGAARLIDALFSRMPVVKMIYSAIKDLMNAFVGEQKGFDNPVRVTLFPGSGIQILGFVTRKSLVKIDDEVRIAVYVPQSYNFGGNVILVPRDQVTPVEVESGKVMAFIISGGVSGF